MFKRAGRQSSQFVRFMGSRLAKNGWWHSFELPDGRIIEGANPLDGLKRRVSLYPISEDLKGKRVLDIGAWDGWFSFEMERRGAEVVAIDCVPSKNFQYIHHELGSRVDYRIMDVYELTPGKLGYFDIVLFLGVLYHLKHPLLGLERVCTLTRDLAIVETFSSPDPGPPLMEFYEITELGGQFDNWVGPNVACILAFCRTAGFARVELLDVSNISTALVACHRRFPEVRHPAGAAPELTGVAHMVNFGVNFCSARDEYVTCWFRYEAKQLQCEDVQARVGELDAAPVFIGKVNDAWQINFKLPLGLEEGWHEVRVRVKQTPWSNSGRLAVDIPLSVEALTITGACDGRTWTPDRVELNADPVLSLWVEGIPENARAADLVVQFGGTPAEITHLGPWELTKPSQLNVRLPSATAPGEYQVLVSLANVWSAPYTIRAGAA